MSRRNRFSPREQNVFGTKKHRNEFKKVKVIANIKSGRASESLRNSIRDSLHKHGITPDEIAPAADPQSTVAFSKDCAKRDYDLVIGAGGDGTLNTILNGLAESETALGVIPTGTANVLARSLGVPQNIEDACRIIAHGQTQRIDLGRVNEHYFGCNSGVGFDAHVLRSVGSDLKKRFGLLAYIGTAVHDFFSYKFSSIRVRLDDGPRQKGYLLLVNNTKYYGGDFLFTPHAKAGDGLLDVVLFKKKDPGTILRYLNSIRIGKISEQEDVVYAQVKKAYVYRHGKHPIHVDGEYFSHAPAVYSVVPNALTVCRAPGIDI